MWTPEVTFNPELPVVACWLLAAGSAAMIGLAKAGFGGGVGVVAVPMAIFAFKDPRLAIGWLLPMLIVGDWFSLGHHWGTWDLRNVKLLLPGLVVGVVLGSLVLWGFQSMEGGEAAQDQSALYLKIVIGIICTTWVVADILRARFAPDWALPATWISGSTTGVVAGLVSTIAHTAGPVITVYLMSQNLSKRVFVGTSILYYTIGNLIKVPAYALLTWCLDVPLWNPDALKAAIWFVVFVPIGTFAGAWLNRRINDALFRKVILAIVFISGVELMGFGEVIRNWAAPDVPTETPVQQDDSAGVD